LKKSDDEFPYENEDIMFRRKKHTTESIVAAIRTGGAEGSQAIDYLYAQYRDNFIRFVHLRNGEKEDALDVFQDTVIVLVNNIECGAFKGESNIKTYLFSIGKKLWYKKFNKKIREGKALKEMAVDYEVPTSDPWLGTLNDERGHFVKSVVGRLKESHQKILLLWMQGHDMKEIATQMGLKNAQVARNYKSRAMKELNMLLQENEPLRTYLFK